MPITMQRVLVTPEKAAELMTKNINRNLPAVHGVKFKNIILRGEWLEDGNPVRRDAEGYVRDGQSRLKGIILAGEELALRGEPTFKAAVFMIIVDGIDPKAQLVMDTGRKRTFAHFLQIRGVGETQAIQSITTLLWRWNDGQLLTRAIYGKHFPSDHMQLWDLYLARQDDIKQAKQVAALTKRTLSMNLSILAVGWLLFSDIDPKDCEEFFATLQMQRDLVPGTGPQLLMRQFTGKLSRRFDQQEQLAYLIKSWNLFRDGGIRDMLIWKPGGRTQESMPIPR